MQKDKDKWPHDRLLWKRRACSLMKWSTSHLGVSCTSMAIKIKWCPSWSFLYLQVLTMALSFTCTPASWLMTLEATISWIKLVVATLALGSWPKQGFARLRAKIGARECGRMWEWTLTLPNELPFWELESQKTFKTLKNDCKGQNLSPWGILYIIGNLLKCRCPKWARMTHLDIYNTSYGQKKGWESNWQFDFWPQKVGNRPDSFACRWRATRHWKALNEGYNFGLDLILIQGLHKKL